MTKNEFDVIGALLYLFRGNADKLFHSKFMWRLFQGGVNLSK